MPYNVKIDVFEGPFDLLLHLVRVNEMDIYDIRIAEITQQYLGHIQKMEKLDLDVAGEFLVMAATLIHLKSRTLVPSIGDEEEEDEEEIDEEYESIRSAQDLMRRLVEYRQFKELAVELSDKEDEQLRVFYRNTVLPAVTDESPAEELREDINVLFSAFARVLAYADGLPGLHVTEEEFSVQEKIDLIRSRLEMDRRVSLVSLFKRCINKREMITLFLALLEVCRLRQARIRHARALEDISVVHPADFTDEDDE